MTDDAPSPSPAQPAPPPGPAQPAPAQPARPAQPAPPAQRPAPRPAFEVHRSGRPGGGGPDVRQDPRIVRLIVAFVVFGGVGLIGWLLARPTPGPPRLLPSIVDEPRLGMTLAELQDQLGALPYTTTPPDPEGPRQLELQDRLDRKKRGVQVIMGDPIVADTRFVDGKLAHFHVEASSNLAGAPIGITDVMALLPVLAEAKTLRRPYPQADLEDALGRGARCALTLDAAEGKTEVFRWDVEVDGRRQARFVAHVRGGLVIAHDMSSGR